MKAITIARQVAHDRGYTYAEFDAAIEYIKRKRRKVNPPGIFDRVGRFHCSEPFRRPIAAPTRARPYSEMHHARSARHVAHVFQVSELATKRLGRIIEALDDRADRELSNHAGLQLASAIMRRLKPMP